jgi:hypothetical protein
LSYTQPLPTMSHLAWLNLALFSASGDVSFWLTTQGSVGDQGCLGSALHFSDWAKAGCLFPIHFTVYFWTNLFPWRKSFHLFAFSHLKYFYLVWTLW